MHTKTMTTTIYNSIYDLSDLTAEEEKIAINSVRWKVEQMRFFESRDKHQKKRTLLKKILPNFIYVKYSNWLFKKSEPYIYAPISREEYVHHTTQQERYGDLFLIYRHRGDFVMARRYELLSQQDYVSSFECIPRDCFMRNEPDYYLWLMRLKTLYIDLDNVLVDFQSGIDQLDEATRQQYKDHLDDVPGIFAKMLPMKGAVEAFRMLSERYDVYILSTAPWNNPSAWSDKLLWVQKYLGDWAYKRLILSHHKNLCMGDCIIDDRKANGVYKFKGYHIHFGSERFPDWYAVLKYLLPPGGEEK